MRFFLIYFPIWFLLLGAYSLPPEWFGGPDEAALIGASFITATGGSLVFLLAGRMNRNEVAYEIFLEKTLCSYASLLTLGGIMFPTYFVSFLSVLSLVCVLQYHAIGIYITSLSAKALNELWKTMVRKNYNV